MVRLENRHQVGSICWTPTAAAVAASGTNHGRRSAMAIQQRILDRSYEFLGHNQVEYLKPAAELGREFRHFVYVMYEFQHQSYLSVKI